MSERPRIAVGLGLLPTDDVRAANEPLFDEGLVDAVEWSVDFGFDGPLPDWLERRLTEYSERDALFAHGVELSPLSVDWAPEQEAWLASLERACRTRRYRHLTEHYGFMTAEGFVRGTPLPLPPSRSALALAARRFEELRSASGLAIGVENLAFAFSRDDAIQQASFVRSWLDATGGFLLLDVHNLLCQLENFGLHTAELLSIYPLDRVREIHVAGGAVTHPRVDPDRRPFRRDSHDESVPPSAFELLAHVLPRCPALEVVILERSDHSLFGREEAERHRADFRELVELVRRSSHLESGPETTRGDARPRPLELVADDEGTLADYQRHLLATLGSDASPAEQRARLATPETPYAAHARTFEPRAVEVASAMAREWSQPRPAPGAMTAAVFMGPGAPLVLRGLPRVSPGRGQIVLRPTAVGLCGTDIHILAGRFPVPTPIVLGHETVGVVEALGEGVTGFAEGDLVGTSWVQAGCGACPRCARGETVRCVSPRTWIENGGGLSELVVAEASGATRLPDGLAPELAAPLFCAGHTVMSGYLRARPTPSDRVAVLGVGGLGHLAIQIARAHGHDVVALTSHADKRRDALALGASVAPAYDGNPGEALERAGGANIVLATTSSYADVASVASGLAVGGRLVVMGLGEGTLALEPVDLIQREAEVLFSVQGG
ncbi:MAG TPA: DUF692 family protein, partial [Polyangiaceae bacterium]|nr:DUF692 family protein [Polyangiaceae bacterium]